MTYTRDQQVRDLLINGTQAALEPFEILECSHPAWLDVHPSGFGAICRIEEGDKFFFNAQRIADTVASYEQGPFTMYVDSILDWWVASVLLLSVGMELKTALMRFSVDFPDSFGWFASHPDIMSGRFTMGDWLAPEWKES